MTDPYSSTHRQPQYRGDIETVHLRKRSQKPYKDPRSERAAGLAERSAALTVALHGILTKAIEAERGSLNADHLNDLQDFLNKDCNDLVSDFIDRAFAAAGVDITTAVLPPVPDFAALAAAGPVSPRSREFIDEVMLNHWADTDTSTPESKPDFASASIIAAGDK